MIGLTGAHRTGKSTLARAYADYAGIKYVQTKASQTFNRLGFSPKEDYPFEIRLMIQHELLVDMDKLYSESGLSWITDRTPIDLLAYTMADIQRANLREIHVDAFIRYMAACISCVNAHFTNILVVQPGIPLFDESGKAPCNNAYMEHLNALVLGIVVDQRIKPYHYYIPRDVLNLEARVKAIEFAVNRTKERYQVEVERDISIGIRPRLNN